VEDAKPEGKAVKLPEVLVTVSASRPPLNASIAVEANQIRFI
jgi:hypothetical protein